MLLAGSAASERLRISLSGPKSVEAGRVYTLKVSSLKRNFYFQLIRTSPKRLHTSAGLGIADFLFCPNAFDQEQ